MKDYVTDIGMVKGFIFSIIIWIGGISLQNVDLYLGIALKVASLISFSLLITINLPTAYKQIKKWFKK